MMILYYKPGTTPTARPPKIFLKNGLERSEYTTQELLEAGYIEAPPKPTATFPQRVEWTGSAWIVRDPNEGEINTQILWIREEAVRRLAATDYKVTKAAEAGSPVADEIKQYRQRLRDIYNLIDVPNIWSVDWPTLL